MEHIHVSACDFFLHLAGARRRALPLHRTIAQHCVLAAHPAPHMAAAQVAGELHENVQGGLSRETFTPPLVIAFLGSVLGAYAGCCGWWVRSLPPPQECPDEVAHFKHLAGRVSRVRLGALLAALLWLSVLIYQISLGVGPNGSITEARASRQLNNGCVSLMFIGVAALILAYANVCTTLLACVAVSAVCPEYIAYYSLDYNCGVDTRIAGPAAEQSLAGAAKAADRLG
eukprot:SAG25_NODE_2937_length_1306_cov_5.142502_2_plen_229_part_00